MHEWKLDNRFFLALSNGGTNKSLRTQTSNSSTEVSQDRCTSIAHFTLHCKLSLHIDLTEPDTETSDDYTGNREDRCDQNDRHKSDEEERGELDDKPEILSDGSVNCLRREPGVIYTKNVRQTCGDILSATGNHTGGWSSIQPPQSGTKDRSSQILMNLPRSPETTEDKGE